MARVKKNLEAKRQRIADLLRADVPIKTILEITGASKTTVYDLKTKLEAGNSVENVVKQKSKHGAPPPNLKLSLAFLKDLKNQYKIDPNISMRKMAIIMKVSENTIRRGVKELGLASKIHPKRHLLTAKQKEKRLNMCKKILNVLKSKHRSTTIIFSDIQT